MEKYIGKYSVKDFLYLILGAFIYSIGTHSFIETANIAPGGAVGVALMLNPVSYTHLDVYKRQILQKRRSTPWDGVNLAKHGKVIDDKTEPGDLLVISMGGIMDVSTGGDLLALRAQLRGVQGELTDGCLRDTDDIAAFGFPAYSAGTAPNKSAYDIETVGVDVPCLLYTSHTVNTCFRNFYSSTGKNIPGCSLRS